MRMMASASGMEYAVPAAVLDPRSTELGMLL
jgi:hypothetical protein